MPKKSESSEDEIEKHRLQVDIPMTEWEAWLQFEKDHEFPTHAAMIRAAMANLRNSQTTYLEEYDQNCLVEIRDPTGREVLFKGRVKHLL